MGMRSGFGGTLAWMGAGGRGTNMHANGYMQDLSDVISSVQLGGQEANLSQLLGHPIANNLSTHYSNESLPDTVHHILAIVCCISHFQNIEHHCNSSVVTSVYQTIFTSQTEDIELNSLKQVISKGIAS